MIERNFIKEILSRINEHAPLMQFVVGPRQVGKTTGIEQLLKKYKKNIFINLLKVSLNTMETG